MRKLFIFIILIISSYSDAQTVRGFAGVSGYLHSDFEESLIGSINLGAEFEVKRYLKPEVELSVLFGEVERVVKRDNFGNITSFFNRTAVSYSINFSPKICLGNNGDNTDCFVIIPKYSFSNVTAVGKYTSIKSNNLWSTEKETISEWQHSLGIGVGYEIGLSEYSNNSLSVNIYCQNIDLGKILNELNHSGPSRINTNYMLGIGCNYYFGSKKK